MTFRTSTPPPLAARATCGPAVVGFALAATLLALSSTSFAADAVPVDDELEKYWNVEIAVPTTQNPMHTRAGKFELSLSGGVVPNDSYYLALPVGARAGFHISSTLALEAGFSYLITKDSDLHDFLKTAGKSGLLQNVKKPPHMYLMSSLDLIYSPFHGKVGIFDRKLSSFDIGVMVGVGAIGVELDTQPTTEADPLQAGMKLAGHWGAVLRFYLNEWSAVRWEVRQFGYKPEDAFLFPIEFSLNISFLLN